MKKCNNCGTQLEDLSNFCTACGSSDVSSVSQYGNFSSANEQFNNQNTPEFNTANPLTQTAYNDNGNILAGISGAFLFSLIGALLYFILYQIGFIAGITGFVMFSLSNFGYRLFAKTKNKVSLPGLIISIIMTVIMILVAEYISLSFQVFQELKSYYAITFFDAIRITPEFLADSEVLRAVISDLALAYLFTFIATISDIVNIVKERKKQKQSQLS